MQELKLENQICFPFCAISRLITKAYKPFLDKLSLTYPQYLVFLVLWEKDNIPVKYLSEKLLLDTNTLTPLLKRMEENGFLKRKKDKIDKRSTLIALTKKGKDLKQKAKDIPKNLYKSMQSEEVTEADLQNLKKQLDTFTHILQEKTK